MQNNILLSPISLDELMNQLRGIIKEELQAELNKEQEQLVSADYVCTEMLNISRKTLYNWCAQGVIRKYKISGKSLYKKSEILASLTCLKRYHVKTINQMT